MTATVAGIMSALQESADPVAWVSRSCRGTEALLAHALERRDVPLAAEAKIVAEETHYRAMREEMPKDVQVRASATIRLAERTIALAIRAGQEAGEIRKQGDNREVLPSPSELAGFRYSSDLSGYYSLADGITDEEFTAALAACVRDQNVTRAHILRKIEAARAQTPGSDEWIPEPLDRSPEAAARRRDLIRDYAAEGYTSRQMGERLRTTDVSIRKIARDMGVVIHADQVVVGTRRAPRSSRIAEETVTALDGLAAAVNLIDFDAIDPAQAQNWAASLTDSLRALNRFAKKIKETTL